MTPRRKLMALVERFVPPPPKPPASIKAKVAPKPSKPIRKPPRRIYRSKTYDASIRYQPPAEAPHPVSMGVRTVMMGVGGKALRKKAAYWGWAASLQESVQ